MNRSDLVKKASRACGVPAPQVEKVLTGLLAAIETTLASGDYVVITNFGRFETRDRAPTVRRNPRFGNEIKVPRKTGVLFRPAPSLKAHVQREELT